MTNRLPAAQIVPPQGRQYLPGGHAADGGFYLTEPTPDRRNRTTEQLAPVVIELEQWHTAAVELCAAYSLSAKYGANNPINDLIRDREARYDAARTRYLYALQDQEN